MPGQPERQVGTSQLAQQLESEGYFAEMGQRFAFEREQETQRAVEESQGFSLRSLTNAIGNHFSERGLLGGAGRYTTRSNARPQRWQNWRRRKSPPRARAPWPRRIRRHWSRATRCSAALAPGELPAASRFGADD